MKKTVAMVAVAALSSLVACGEERGHGHGHGDHETGHDHDSAEHGDHEHHEDAIGITRWSDALELYAEHPPARVGDEIELLAHVTILDGFRAPEEGAVTLVLEGPARVEASVDAPARPGIFRPTFRAPSAGTYAGTLRVRLPGLEEDIGGFEIVVHSEGGEPPHEDPDDDAHTISFLKEQQWRVPFATEFAARRALVPTVEVSGEVTTPPGGSAELGAPIPGRIVAPPTGLPRPGDTVAEGQLLATLAPAPAAPEDGARASLVVVEAEARAATARAAVERARRLLADRAIAAQELELAEREAEVAAEAVAAARRAQRLFQSASTGRGPGTFRITAPIAGVLTRVEAAPGSSVSAGEVLFAIVDASELWVRARVPEHDAPRIRADDDASFRILGLDEWLPIHVSGDDADAAVVTVGRTVDRRSRTVDLIYALRRPDVRLRVGATVRVAVPAGEATQSVSVPRSALVHDEGRDVVYVQVEGEAFEERVVRLGSRAGPWVAVEDGVGEGDRVVTRGANLVRLAARASSAPSHGHVH